VDPEQRQRRLLGEDVIAEAIDLMYCDSQGAECVALEFKNLRCSELQLYAHHKLWSQLREDSRKLEFLSPDELRKLPLIPHHQFHFGERWAPTVGEFFAKACGDVAKYKKHLRCPVWVVLRVGLSAFLVAKM
jgi:hypothetical protein